VTTRANATKSRRRRSARKYVPPEHPCDRSDVRAIVFAIQALERTLHEELTTPDYLSHRRELHIRLAKMLAPEGGRFGRSETVRLDVRIYRALRDRLRQRADDSYHGDFDTMAVRVLEGVITNGCSLRFRRIGPVGSTANVSMRSAGARRDEITRQIACRSPQ